jgi:hypothetical protein
MAVEAEVVERMDGVTEWALGDGAALGCWKAIDVEDDEWDGCRMGVGGCGGGFCFRWHLRSLGASSHCPRINRWSESNESRLIVETRRICVFRDERMKLICVRVVPLGDLHVDSWFF